MPFGTFDIDSLLRAAMIRRNGSGELQRGRLRLRRARRRPPRRRGGHRPGLDENAGRLRGASRRRFFLHGPLLAVTVIVIGAMIVAHPAAIGGTASADRPNTSQAQGTAHVIPAASTGSQSPNIVFVLTDDLSMDLLRYMPAVQALERRGITFTNYFVSDSLCCPSRASIFTGNYPHDTGVWTNHPPSGGYTRFTSLGEDLHTFNNVLYHDGYRTAMMGKYLNGYLMSPIVSSAVDRFVPTGWSEWDVAGWGYPEYNYLLNADGVVRRYGHKPSDYLTSVITGKGIHFIDHSVHAGRPFFLELATFAPHTPYVPAPRDRHDFPGLKAPEPPSFNRVPTGAPNWLVDHPKLKPSQIRQINEAFRKRARDVQSIDRMITAIESTLRAKRLLNNTYIVFSSDNGLHTGEYRLMPGKLTAFNTDIHVPLVIAGPGIKPGTSTGAVAENVDLAKTFAAMGGDDKMQDDGHTLFGLIEGDAAADWRNALLVEHQGPVTDRNDPDKQDRDTGNPPSYEAMRTRQFLYVEYATGEREFYDLRHDPSELHNVIRTLSTADRADLHRELAAMRNCHTGPDCWAAQHVAALP